MTDFNRWSYRNLNINKFLSTVTHDLRIKSSLPLEIYARGPLLCFIQLVLSVDVVTLIDYFYWYSFRRFCCMVMQRKFFLHSLNIHRFCKLNVLSAQLVKYNISVAKYAEIPAGQPLFFIEAINEQSSRIWFSFFFFFFFYQQKFQTNENYMALKEGSLMRNIPKRNIASG